VLVTHWSVFTC